MAEGFNSVTLLGNLGADPEIRDVGGRSVLNLRLATSETWRDKQSGEKRERTDWHSVALWGDKRPQALARILSKGDRILVHGSVQYRQYEKNGETRWSTDIIAREVVLSGGGKRDGGSRGGGGRSGGGYGGGGSAPADDFNDSDMPF